ncbi:MAG: cytochrome C assembly protein, partial [Anaerolineales bacterium]
SVPITFMAIRLFRTIHPVVFGTPSADAQGDFAISPGMQVAFFFAIFAFTIIFVDLFWHRIRLGNLAAQVEEARMQLEA